MPVTLGLANEDGFPHAGTIDFIDNQVNPKTGTLRVRGTFPNQDEVLLPGFFARVRMPIGAAPPALLVTDRAIDNDQGQKILYIVNDKNEVVSRPIRVGIAARRPAGDRGRPEIGRAGDRQRPANGSAGHHRRPQVVDMPQSIPKSEKQSPPLRDRESDFQRNRLCEIGESDFPGNRHRIQFHPSDPIMLVRFFIDRPVLAWVISLVILLMGAIAVVLLPVSQYPEITPPVVRVTASYPGANAQIIADTVAAPIEQQVVGVEKMLYMSSQSNNDGSYILDVTFAVGTDSNMAQVLVQNRVAIAQPTLPDMVKAIGVTVRKRSPDILLIVNLYSDINPDTGQPYYDQLYLSNYATINLQDALARDRRRGRRFLLRRAGLQHARVAGPGQAASPEPDGQRRDPGLARAERAGGGRADRPAAGPPGPGLPVHHEHPRPAGRGRTVRQHHRQDRHGRGGRLPQGRGPNRTGGQEPGL